MRIIRAKDYKDMSRKAANIISAQVILKPDSVLGLATGSSPIGTYEQLVKWYEKGDLDFADVTTVNLDEYYGMKPENDQSYHYFMNDNLFNHVNINKEKSFFLYYGLHQPHVPRVPNERFVGKSGMGPRGDAILEADWCVSEFLKELDKLGLTENTIVIFTSDNGPVLDDGYKDQAEELVGDHKIAGPLRGGKTSMFDGGTRIPLMLRWPARVKP